jgi:hypothetical protein
MGITMLKRTHPILLVLLAGVGAYLAAGHGQDRPNYWWADRHLKIAQERLGILKDYLLQYKQTHGHYPTNDEGLGVLDFDSRFKYPVKLTSSDKDHVYWDRDIFARALTDFGKDELRHYRARIGHAPSDAEEFSSTPVAWMLDLGVPDAVGTIDFDIAIGKDDNFFLLHSNQVLSPWLTPLLYENRRGLPPAAFAASPVNRDEQGQFSVRVDDGVYICCLEGETYTHPSAPQWWGVNWPRVLGAVMVLVALALLVQMLVRKQRRIVGVVGLIFSAAVGAGLDKTSYMTCYVMSPLFSRPPQTVTQQRELLGKYRAAGVIGEAAYQKAVEALDLKKFLQPTTRPTATTKKG